MFKVVRLIIPLGRDCNCGTWKKLLSDWDLAVHKTPCPIRGHGDGSRDSKPDHNADDYDFKENGELQHYLQCLIATSVSISIFVSKVKCRVKARRSACHWLGRRCDEFVLGIEYGVLVLGGLLMVGPLESASLDIQSLVLQSKELVIQWLALESAYIKII